MIRNVVTLTLNDLAISFKNKTLLLILFIPLFIFCSLILTNQSDADFKNIKIGLLQKGDYPVKMIQSIQSADRLFTIYWFSDREEAKQGLKDKRVDGVLVPSDNVPQRMELMVLTKTSYQTLIIGERVSALQKASEGKDNSWISVILPLQASSIQQQTLPTWILMLALLVGLIIIPAQVAEEKEKKLLLGLLQTPIREIEWLLAKLLLGMILIGVAVIFLHQLGRYDFNSVDVLGYVAFLIVGGFCFSSFGIFLGFLCRTQASARTLGVLFYLPLLLPSALSDFSQRLSEVAPFFPSYHFYWPIKSILVEGGSLSAFPLDWIYLFCIGLGTSLLSYLLMRKRWMM
jgi:ABC-2 type transport system permease protein